MTYLIPARRIFELAAAMYAAGFGLWVWMVMRVYGAEPLYWTTLTLDEQRHFAWFLIGFGLIHSFGIWLNGRWMYSPFIRVIGMAGMCWLIFTLATHTSNRLSTGVYNYAFVSALLFTGLLSAIADARTALMKRRISWTL